MNTTFRVADMKFIDLIERRMLLYWSAESWSHRLSYIHAQDINDNSDITNFLETEALALIFFILSLEENDALKLSYKFASIGFQMNALDNYWISSHITLE